MEKVQEMKERELFKMRQQAPLEMKEAMSKDRIRKFIDWCDDRDMDVYQSDSGGWDSTILRHMIESMGFGGVIPSVFSNTGLELPEIVKFVRRRKNLIEVKPKKHFKAVWEEDGIPVASKMTSKMLRVLQGGRTERNKNMYRLYDEGIDQHGNPTQRYKLAKKWRHLVNNEYGLKFTDKCCDHLKKEPLDTFQKNHGGGRLDGMMASEGGMREGKHVCTIFDDKKPHSSPLLFWTEKDKIEYTKKYDLEICEVYYDRVFNEGGDCVACDSPFTDHLTVLEWEEWGKDFTEFNVDGDGVTWKCHKDRTGDFMFFIQGEKRTGCSFCGFGAHMEKGANRFQKLSVSHPRLHNIIMSRMGMSKAMDLINVPITFIGDENA